MVQPAVYCKPKPPKNAKAQLAEGDHMYEAIVLLYKDPTRKIMAASREFVVNYHTLYCHYLSEHTSQHQAHEHQQLLTHAEEQVLVDWMKQLNRPATQQKISQIQT